VYSLGLYTSEDESDCKTPRGGASWLGTLVAQLGMHVRINRIAKVIHDMIGPPFLLDGVRFIRIRIIYIKRALLRKPKTIYMPIFLAIFSEKMRSFFDEESQACAACQA